MKTKAIALLIVLALMFSMCIIMTGCGEKNDKSDKETTAASVKPTEAATAAPAATVQATENADGQDTNKDENGETTAQSGTESGAAGSDSDVYAGISRGEAMNKALAETADMGGLTVTITEKGDYNGEECWMVGVQDTVGKILTCYVGADFCYVEDRSTDGIFTTEYAGTSAQEAGNTAVSAAGGSGWTIISCEKSTYNGEEAWYVTIQNYEDESSMSAYVIGNECYFE